MRRRRVLRRSSRRQRATDATVVSTVCVILPGEQLSPCRQARRSVVAHAGDDEVHKLQGEVSGPELVERHRGLAVERY
jgi:hypothetical protein